MPKRTDHNQPDISAALRRMGASVFSLHKVGKGCPDLLVGYRGLNFLVEVKNGEKAKLTEDQRAFHQCWRGQSIVLASPEQAIAWIRSINGR